MKKAFTLIELMISIVILSIIMLFLYKAYSGLNKSNVLLKEKSDILVKEQLVKKTIYLDITTALNNSIKIIKQDAHTDVLFLQTAHSLHKRINPYVAYILKDKQLYRLESFKKFTNYPLDTTSNFVVDKLSKADSFRVYKSQTKAKHTYLVALLSNKKDKILLKIHALNEK